MSRPRILFLMPFFGFPSHFIPLVKLYQRLPRSKYDVAFFLPRLSPAQFEAQQARGMNPDVAFYYSRQFLEHFDLPLLDLEQRFSVVDELAAYRKFSPDLIVDDSSLTTALARQVQWLPRLAIARAGVYGDPATPVRYSHSLTPMIEALHVAPFERPSSIDGYFEAEAHIVPATRALQRLPGLPDGGSRAFYCGPLMLDEREEMLLHSAPLAQFMEANRGRRIAYVTFGVDASRNPHAPVLECMRELLHRGFAVITNMRLGEPPISAPQFPRERYYYSNALPMHYVCSRASLVVHVAGSAAYHYPLLHDKRAITVGTRCRDREDVAQTLAALGLSLHLPAPAETPTFLAQFVAALDTFEGNGFPFDAGLTERLAAQRLDIEATAARFDIDAAIETALCARPARPQRAGRA